MKPKPELALCPYAGKPVDRDKATGALNMKVDSARPGNVGSAGPVFD
jgi:hypothetical protein